MNGFFAFIKDFCLIAVAGGVIMLLLPNGNMSKHLKLIISLCMICALTSATVSAFGAGRELMERLEYEIEEEYAIGAGTSRAEVARQAKLNLEREVKSLVSERFGSSGDDIIVIVSIDASDLDAVRITGVTVFLSDMEENEAVREYVETLFCGEAAVTVARKGE